MATYVVQDMNGLVLTLVKDGSDDLSVASVEVVMGNEKDQEVVYQCPSFYVEGESNYQSERCSLVGIVE